MFVKNLFFISISKFQSYRYLSGDFYSNMGFLSTEPPVFDTTGTGLVVLTGIILSL